MGDAVVTFEQLMAAFPRITNRSKLFAKKVLPLRASGELAALVAALMSDGHVEWYTSDGSPRTRKIILYSSNEFECKWFLSLVKNVFGVTGKVQAYTPNHNNWRKQPYKAIVWNAAVARILILAGAPAGNKTEKEFLIPGWIMGGSREIKSEFLRAFFSFEGSKPMLKTNRQFSFQIDLTMVKSKPYLESALCFFEQIKRLLLEFGVKSTRIIYFQKRDCPKDYKYIFNFSIMRQKSIVNFYRHVGYFGGEKQKLLTDVVIKISAFGRIRSNQLCALISELKCVFGTDRSLANEINKFTKKKYSNRQMEHFRRNETKVPLELLFALIKIKKDEAILKELPEHVQFLYELNSSAPLFP